MTVFKEIEVCVQVNGAPLPEYDVPDDEINLKDYYKDTDIPQVHRYIECVPNALFAVSVKALSPFNFRGCDYVGTDTYIDGKGTSNILLNCKNLIHLDEGSVAGAAGALTVKKYRFAELQFNTETSKLQDFQRSEAISMSTIRIILQRHIRLRDSANQGMTRREFGHAKPSEKNLKGCGKDTYTELDTLDVPVRLNIVETRVFEDRPFAIVVFHYFTRDALQKIGVLSRPPTPIPLEQRRISELTHEEALELLQRKQANAAEQEELAKELKSKLAQARQQILNFKKRDREDAEDEVDDEIGGDDVQVVKKQKLTGEIEIIELDD